MDSASKLRNKGTMNHKFDDSMRNEGAVHVPQNPRVRPTTPSWYFFYGTLTDPTRLAQVAELDEQPTMTKAKIIRSSLKYLGHYAMLCTGNGTVDGVAWFVPTSDIIIRIREYESDAYKEYPKFVELENGDEILAMTFIWNGDEEDLEDEDWATRQRRSSSEKALASKQSNDPGCPLDRRTSIQTTRASLQTPQPVERTPNHLNAPLECGEADDYIAIA